MRRAGEWGASKKGTGPSRCRCREVQLGVSPAGSEDHAGVGGGEGSLLEQEGPRFFPSGATEPDCGASGEPGLGWCCRQRGAIECAGV